MSIFRDRVRRLDAADISLIKLTVLFAAFIVARFWPELLDVNPWFWATLVVLCAARPLYHFWIRGANA